MSLTKESTTHHVTSKSFDSQTNRIQPTLNTSRTCMHQLVHLCNSLLKVCLTSGYVFTMRSSSSTTRKESCAIYQLCTSVCTYTDGVSTHKRAGGRGRDEGRGRGRWGEGLLPSYPAEFLSLQTDILNSS